MRINWEKWGFRVDSGSLIWAGIVIFACAVGMLLLYFSKEKIDSKDDITFINGPFANYRWIEHGGGRGSSLTFKLQNYNNRFKIKADFFPALQKDEFKTIPYGEALVIGIPNSFAKYLNRPKEPFFIYSISSSDFTYLDLNETIPKHNSPLFLYGAGLFLAWGYLMVYLGRRAKVKTPLW